MWRAAARLKRATRRARQLAALGAWRFLARCEPHARRACARRAFSALERATRRQRLTVWFARYAPRLLLAWKAQAVSGRAQRLLTPAARKARRAELERHSRTTTTPAGLLLQPNDHQIDARYLLSDKAHDATTVRLAHASPENPHASTDLVTTDDDKDDDLAPRGAAPKPSAAPNHDASQTGRAYLQQYRRRVAAQHAPRLRDSSRRAL